MYLFCLRFKLFCVRVLRMKKVFVLRGRGLLSHRVPLRGAEYLFLGGLARFRLSAVWHWRRIPRLARIPFTLGTLYALPSLCQWLWAHLP